MTEILTVRLPPGLLAKIDQRAAREGRPRSDYVRRLIEKDAERAPEPRAARFACLRLKGRHALGRGGDNAAVRAALARRAHEKDS